VEDFGHVSLPPNDSSRSLLPAFQRLRLFPYLLMTPQTCLRSSTLACILAISSLAAFPLHAAETDPTLDRTATTSTENLESRLTRIMAEKKVHDRLSKLSETGLHLTLEEIPASLEAARNFKQLRERVVLREATLKRWSQLSPEESLSHASNLPESRLKYEAVGFAVTKLAARSPEKAAAALLKLPPGASRNGASDALAETWARGSAPDALRWASGLSDGASKQSAFQNIWFVWVHTDPAAAAAEVHKVPAGDIKNALITNIAGEWAAVDPAAAIRWAEGLPPGTERQLAQSNIAGSWADWDPVAAGVFALALPDEATSRLAVGGVAERWATQDPQASAGWLAKAPGAVHQAGLSRLMQIWAQDDPQSAGQWVDGLPEGALRQTALESYSDAAVRWTPDLAVARAAKLENESIRQQKVEAGLQRWMELDPTAARQWVHESGLSAETKARFPIAENSGPKRSR